VAYLTNAVQGNVGMYLKSTRMNHIKVGLRNSKSGTQVKGRNQSRFMTQADVVSMNNVS
jgi:hypothetical protein